MRYPCIIIKPGLPTCVLTPFEIVRTTIVDSALFANSALFVRAILNNILLVHGGDESDSDGSALLLFARVVIGEVHVLGGRSLHRVVGHSDSALVVDEQVDGALKLGEAALGHVLFPLLCLFGGLGSGAVLAMVSASGDVAVAL